MTVPVTLAPGDNDIRFYNDTVYGPDLDRIVVTGTAPLVPWQSRPPIR